eukprot:2989933-Rhodomonas_salina.1
MSLRGAMMRFMEARLLFTDVVMLVLEDMRPFMDAVLSGPFMEARLTKMASLLGAQYIVDEDYYWLTK